MKLELGLELKLELDPELEMDLDLGLEPEPELEAEFRKLHMDTPRSSQVVPHLGNCAWTPPHPDFGPKRDFARQMGLQWYSWSNFWRWFQKSEKVVSAPDDRP